MRYTILWLFFKCSIKLSLVSYSAISQLSGRVKCGTVSRVPDVKIKICLVIPWFCYPVPPAGLHFFSHPLKGFNISLIVWPKCLREEIHGSQMMYRYLYLYKVIILLLYLQLILSWQWIGGLFKSSFSNFNGVTAAFPSTSLLLSVYYYFGGITL